MIVPRSEVKESFIDVDREDYRDMPEERYMNKTQEVQLTSGWMTTRLEFTRIRLEKKKQS